MAEMLKKQLQEVKEIYESYESLFVETGEKETLKKFNYWYGKYWDLREDLRLIEGA